MKKALSRPLVLLLIAALGVSALVATTALASSKSSKKSVQVCVLLPDTKSSVRWVQFDAPLIAKALKTAGVTYQITNALNDPQKQKAQAQSCLAAGAKVVIETCARQRLGRRRSRSCSPRRVGRRSTTTAR